MGRYVATTSTVIAQYTRIWGEEYRSHSEYIEPAKLLSLLADIGKDEAISAKGDGGYFYQMSEFVAYHVKQLQVHVTDQDTWSVKQGRFRHDYSIGEFINYLKDKLPVYNNTITQAAKEAGVPRLLMESIVPAVEVFVRSIRVARKSELMEKLAYVKDEKAEEKATKFIQGLLNIYFIDPTPANIAVFKHLIWSIKRNIFLLPVDNPLFYTLHSSKQGTGKTTFFRKLCTGFEWIYSPGGRLASLLQKNDHKAMVRGKYLLDFQELFFNSFDRMGKVDDAMVGALKSIITTDVITGREMYTTTESIERSATVFVSSTNLHLWDVINDPSGMRRYWEFDMHPPKNFAFDFWLEANEYFDNILYLYRCIDETKDLGYYHVDAPEYPEMREMQASYSRENPLLQFCSAKGWLFVNSDEDGAVQVEFKKLLDKFNAHLLNRGDTKWSAKLAQYVIRVNTECILETIVDDNGRTKETYWMKGYTT